MAQADRKDTKEPAHAPDALSRSDAERRAERHGHDAAGRPLHGEETAPGERGDGPYGDSERGRREARPGT